MADHLHRPGARVIGLRLALRDVSHDRTTFFGLSVVLAAVLAPLLLLMALKTGVVSALLDSFRSHPDYLEIEMLADDSISAPRLEEIRGLPQTGFVSALPLGITATIALVNAGFEEAGAGVRTSGLGDPLLADLPPPGTDEIVVSRELADRLDLVPGDPLLAALENRPEGVFVDVPLTVTGIAPLLSNRWVLVHPDLSQAAQAIRRGVEMPALGVPGRARTDADDVISRVRLYARTIEDVPALAQRMRDWGYIVHSSDVEIAQILDLERNLDFIFAVIALMGGAGYAVALGVSLWVNVQRKRRSFAMLRLMGVRTQALVVFPMVQAALIAGVGTLLAATIYL
ncbi:MAG: hypothetical protein AAFQ51_19530, partial [Pseudomonadota bacterium]